MFYIIPVSKSVLSELKYGFESVLIKVEGDRRATLLKFNFFTGISFKDSDYTNSLILCRTTILKK